jgi:hypothetical protein
MFSPAARHHSAGYDLELFELYRRRHLTTAVIGATGRVGSELVRGVLAGVMGSPRSFVTPTKRAAPSANLTGCAYVPHA